MISFLQGKLDFASQCAMNVNTLQEQQYLRTESVGHLVPQHLGFRAGMGSRGTASIFVLDRPVHQAVGSFCPESKRVTVRPAENPSAQSVTKSTSVQPHPAPRKQLPIATLQQSSGQTLCQLSECQLTEGSASLLRSKDVFIIADCWTCC